MRLKTALSACVLFFALFFIALSVSATEYRYDSLNRLQSMTDDSGNTIVYEYDGAGNITSVSHVKTPALEIKILKVASTRVTLSWAPTAANDRIVAYELYRDGSRVITTAEVIYEDIELLPGKTYEYKVRSLDRSGKYSPFSESIKVTTTAEWEAVDIDANQVRVNLLQHAMHSGTSVTADVYIDFAGSGYRVVDWGELKQEGSDWVADISAEKNLDSTDQEAFTLEHTYHIKPLPAGDYTFKLRSRGKPIFSEKFTIIENKEEWIPVALQASQVRLTVDNQSELTSTTVNIEFAHAGYRIVDWGTTVKNGNSYVVNIVAETLNPMPEDKAADRMKLNHVYDLGSLPAGAYTFAVTSMDAHVVSKSFVIKPWTQGVAYAVGDEVIYEGKVYAAIHGHTALVGWEPPKAPALWKLNEGSVDSTPPSAPLHIRVSERTAATALLSWDASTDNMGVAGYEVQINNTATEESFTTQVADNRYVWSIKDPKSIYVVLIRAKDLSGNLSASTSIQIDPVENLPFGPSSPNQVTVTGVTYDSISLTWEPSISDTGEIVEYIIHYDNEMLVAANTIATINGLNEFTTYSITIRAKDSQGYYSDFSQPITVTTSPPPDVSEWQLDMKYTVGQRVIYNGKIYECRQSHQALTGWEPPNVPALWLEQ